MTVKPIKKKSYTTNKAKMIIATTALAMSTVAVGAVVEQGNEVEASSSTPIIALAKGTLIKLGGIEWILLEPSTGFVVAKDILMQEAFDKGASDRIARFSVTDKNNVGYVLNNDFLKTFTTAEQEIIKNSQWNTKGVAEDNNQYVTAKIGLLTIQEFQSNSTIINAIAKVDYPFTTIVTNNTYNNQVMQILPTGQATSNAASSSNGIRPAFYLKEGQSIRPDGTVITNTAPTKPTLTVPTQQFEHGDKQILGWNASDPDNDVITYTLQAAYNGSTTWETLYTGTNKQYTYTVPNNKTSVKFRVIASDGKLSSTSEESASKSIREVMYYWNKYNTNVYYEPVLEQSSYGQLQFSINKVMYVGDVLKVKADGTIDVSALASVNTNDLSNHINKYLVSQDGKFVSKITGGSGGIGESGQTYVYLGYSYTFTKGQEVKTKGSLTQSNIQAGINAYPNGAIHTDGFWYERGQRVLSDDVTPPIIELTEQTNYAATSKVTVRTHDLGTVQTVKWAKGNQAASYFTSSGTSIATGQSNASSFTVSENGIYTVYAVDAKGNAAVQTIEVKNANTTPVVTGVSPTKPFSVVDANTNAKINVSATDREQSNLTATVSYNGKTATKSFTDSTEVELLGNNYTNGFYNSAVSVTVSDGIASSSPVTINPIIIKVNDATDYNKDLANHTSDANSYTKAQHEAFYNAYAGVLKYETSKLQADYEAAHIAIAELKLQTGPENTTTIQSWINRLAVVHTNAAIEKAEGSFALADYEIAKSLFENLNEINQNTLKARFDELTKYHETSALLLPLEAEINRHKANPSSELDLTVVNAAAFNDVKVAITFLQNVTPNPTKTYKADLNKRFNESRAYYLKNKGTLAPEDLDGTTVNVNTALGGMYDEFREMFTPTEETSTNYLQETVDFVNVLADFMKDVNGTTYNAYKSYVASDLLDTPETVVVTSKIDSVTAVVDAVYDYRQSFKNDGDKLATISQLIADMQVKKKNDGSSIAQTRLNEVNGALKEVTEYTDVPLFEDFSETEKNEGIASLANLFEGQFKTDMTEYLTNGIPEIIFADDAYEYIVDGSLTIKGTFTDDNDSHDVTVTFDGQSETLSNVTTKTFEVTFKGLAEGAYVGKDMSVIVNDKFVSKGVKVLNKPVISVSNPVVYTEMVKALETDIETSLAVMSEGQLTELLSVFNKMIVADRSISPTNLNELYAQAEQLSGAPNGALVKYVHDYVQANLLQWIFENHLIATVEDFALAGVIDNESAVVTSENLEPLKELVTEYKASAGTVSTPTVADYIHWVQLLSGAQGFGDVITAIYASDSVDEIAPLVVQGQQMINDLPTWANSLTTKYTNQLNDAVDYQNALISVISAEGSYTQSDLNIALDKVTLVEFEPANIKLTERLDVLQLIIDADTAMTLAENTFDETDIAEAKVLIDHLTADAIISTGIHATKVEELKGRLAVVDKITEATAAVEKAEAIFATGDLDQAQVDKDAAQILVDALASSTIKDALITRLVDLQTAIDEAVATKAVEQAELTYSQVDHDLAGPFVAGLENEALRLQLESRLDEVQKVINAIAAVEQAELTASDSDIALAQTAINLLQEGAKKEELKIRLDAVKQFADAVKAVVVAEENLTQHDHDEAKSLVDALPNGASKDALLDRLVEVQKFIDAMNAVDKAEGSKLSDDVADAQLKIDALPTGEIKDELQNRLNEVIKYIEAEAAVSKAEETLKQADKNDAEALVNGLQDGPDKDALINRLDELQKEIDKKSAEEKAEDAVEVAESTWNEDDLNTAKDLVDKLEDGSVKESLEDRIEKLEQTMADYTKALEAVEKAEQSKDTADAMAAQTLIDVLPAAPQTVALQDRLDEVNRYIVAEKAVSKAEGSLYQRHFDEAQTLVNALKDGVDKDTLQARLDAIKSEIDGKENSILDRIIDGNPPVTAQELADYTDETVFEELLDDYIDELREIADINGSITKEDVIEIIRLINALEIAKRSMADSDITTYQNQLAVATIPTVDKYPKAQIMFATAAYLANDGEKTALATALAEMLDRDIMSVLDEMNEFLAGVETVEMGSYIVEFVDEEGNVIASETIESAFGEIQVVPTAPKGYELIDETPFTFELNEETVDQVVTFEVRKAENVEMGSYTVQYVNEENNVISTQLVEDVFGPITILPAVPDGFELVGDTQFEFELSAETDGQVFTFVIAPKENEEVEAVTGTYTVKYMTAYDELIHEEVVRDVALGDVTVIATELEGYEIIGDATQTIELTKDSLEQEVIFYVASIDLPISGDAGTGVVPTEPTEGDSEETDSTDELEGTEPEIDEVPETDATENESSTDEVDEPSLVDSNNTESEPVIENEPVNEEVEQIISDTVGEETALVRSLLIASLDDVKFSFSKVATTPEVSHQQYLYQAAQALLMVKAYTLNPSEANLTAASAFIAGNLYDGAYKKYLLDILSMDITDLGEDGEPDLTPVYPYVPPTAPIPTEPVQPTPTEPVNPAPVVPPTVEPTQPIYPTTPVAPPVIDFEVPEEIPGTTGSNEVISDVEMTDDGSYKWTIENPENTEFTLTAPDMTITISLDKSIIEESNLIEVIWKHLGNEHYELIILADGKLVEKFAAKVDLSKERGFAYMLRMVDGDYKSMPYNYTDGKFNFSVNRTGIFYFSKEKRTFNDISKLIEMKPAIEELASRHIVYGTEPGKYAPNASITRAQFAVMIARALGLEASDNETPFADTKGKWYEKDVQALYEAGIVSGVNATTFNPGDELTREQAALMLNKVIEKSGKSTDSGLIKTASEGTSNALGKLPTFADANSIADNARKAVATLELLNIVHGKPDGSFDPKGSLTRSQMAKMLTGVLKFTGDM